MLLLMKVGRIGFDLDGVKHVDLKREVELALHSGKQLPGKVVDPKGNIIASGMVTNEGFDWDVVTPGQAHGFVVGHNGHAYGTRFRNQLHVRAGEKVYIQFDRSEAGRCGIGDCVLHIGD